MASLAMEKQGGAQGAKRGLGKVQIGALVMYCASMLISGSNGIVASGVSLPSSEIVFFRALVGGLFLAIVFFATKGKLTVLKNKRELALLLLSGVAMGAQWLFLYEAYQTAGVGISTILCYLAPIIVMLLAPVLFRERMTLLKVASFVVVVAGSLLINGIALQHGVSLHGIICGLISAAALATMVILNKKVTETGGTERALVQLLAAGVVVAIYVALTMGLPIEVAPSLWPSIIVIGALAAASNLLYFSAVKKLPVQSVAACGYLEPLSAVLMSAVILGEHMFAVQIVGAALILVGALFGEVFGSKRLALSHAK